MGSKTAIIYIFLIISPTYANVQHIKNLVQGNMKLYSDYGLYTEASGTTLSFSTFLYQPIYFTIPERIPFEYNLSACNSSDTEIIKSDIAHSYKAAMEKINDRIDPYESALVRESNRTKREPITIAVLVAAGVMSLMIGMYNTYQVSKFEQESENMRDNIIKVKNAAQESSDAINKLIRNNNDIGTIIIPEIKAKINLLIYNQNCQSQHQSLKFALHQHITENIYVRAVNGINTMYEGKITPDFLPLSDVRKHILTRPDMRNSIYQDETALVYQLGKLIPYQVSKKPFIVSGMLVLPRLLREHIGYTLSIHTVPIYSDQNNLVVLDEPDVVIRDNVNKKIWNPNLSHCIKLMSAMVCPVHETHSRVSLCLTQLIYHDNVEHCKFRKIHGDSMVKQATMGILTSPAITTYHQIKTDADFNRRSTRINFTTTGAHFITIHDAAEVMINDQIYMLATETLDIEPPIEALNINKTGISELVIQDISDIKFITPDLDLLPMHTYSQYGLLLVLALCMILLLIYLYKKLNKQKNHHMILLKTLQNGELNARQ